MKKGEFSNTKMGMNVLAMGALAYARPGLTIRAGPAHSSRVRMAADIETDVLVIGAGPAGTMLVRQPAIRAQRALRRAARVGGGALSSGH
jgi:alkyl hydroperoxide reductase subunit AhpF